LHHFDLRFWNISEGVHCIAGVQRVFNILGNLKTSSLVNSLSYSLNNGPFIPVALNKTGMEGLRLERIGDFNIDTINCEQLNITNELRLRSHLLNGQIAERLIKFPVKFKAGETKENGFKLNLTKIRQPQEVAQIVDGRWKVGRDRNGERCLEISDKDQGLDRVILFHIPTRNQGYKVRSRICVTSWNGELHNVGLVFNWRQHLQGDGTFLPSQWTTGLGYYYSNCKGLRIRMGRDVHINRNGLKVGDQILGEEVLSVHRYWLGRIVKKIYGFKMNFSQFAVGKQYIFELKMERDLYALTVWRAKKPKPPPQIIVNDPPKLLLPGALGIIAHRCGIKIFEFEVIPYS
jgi:hypothetical protein